MSVILLKKRVFLTHINFAINGRTYDIACEGSQTNK